jgi:hypothetical protein
MLMSYMQISVPLNVMNTSAARKKKNTHENINFSPEGYIFATKWGGEADSTQEDKAHYSINEHEKDGEKTDRNSKPSPIRIEIWKKKSSVHSWIPTLKDTQDLGARGLSDCVEGSWRDWNHAKKISKIGFSWMKETLAFSFWQRKKMLQWYFVFIFISTTWIIKFSIRFLSFPVSLLALSFASLVRIISYLGVVAWQKKLSQWHT